ncbi:SH3 domain-containing protein [bacterium]|nr:SH3 domain-containing protein [bacterium]
MKFSSHYSQAWTFAQIVCVFLLTLSTFVFTAGSAVASPAIPQYEQDTSVATTTAEVQVAFTTPSLMNVRSGPGTTFDIVTQVPARTAVEIIAENDAGDWVQARLSGVEGEVWLAKWLLTTDANATAAVATAATTLAATQPSTQPANSTGVIAVTTPSRMNVRGGPGTDYNVVTTVAAGTQAQVRALALSDQWLQVDLSGQSEPVWLFRSLTTVSGSLAGLPRLSDSELPPRPQPVAQARSAEPAASPVVNAPLPTGGGEFAYGLQAHMVHTGGQEGIVMDKTRELGFTWVKQQIEWKIFESSPGQYGFGDINPIVDRANERGMNLLFSVVKAPEWAREPGFDSSVNGPPLDPQTYANFVGALAGNYCGSSLKAIEVWNEQNLHYEWGNKPLSAVEYMNLLRPAYAAIKAACPSMYVVSGALTPAGNNGNLAVDDLRYLEEMFQNGLAQYTDGIGAHPSGFNVPPSYTWDRACEAIQRYGNSFNGACDSPHHSWSFRSTMEGYRNLAIRYGAANLRIWPTEFGWAAGGAFDPRYAYANDNSFEEQAAWTVESFQMMKNWGWVGPTFLWNLNFRVVANGTERAQWGIVNNDWSPLPVFYALRDMAK